jgi:hypothetical protein
MTQSFASEFSRCCERYSTTVPNVNPNKSDSSIEKGISPSDRLLIALNADLHRTSQPKSEDRQ